MLSEVNGKCPMGGRWHIIKCVTTLESLSDKSPSGCSKQTGQNRTTQDRLTMPWRHLGTKLRLLHPDSRSHYKKQHLPLPLFHTFSPSDLYRHRLLQRVRPWCFAHIVLLRKNTYLCDPNAHTHSYILSFQEQGVYPFQRNDISTDIWIWLRNKPAFGWLQV